MKCLLGILKNLYLGLKMGVKGCRRFLERVWRLQDIVVDGEEYTKELETSIHKTIKKSYRGL